MHNEIMELCTRKCVQKDDIKFAQQISIPQRSCFHRCSIKFIEALRFTTDTLNMQTLEIKKQNTFTNQPQISLMDKFHQIYEQHYGQSQSQPVKFPV